MKKLTPRMMSAVYQLAAIRCDNFRRDEYGLDSDPYGCPAIGTALWKVSPYLRRDSELHDSTTADLCDLFTSMFRNAHTTADLRSKYGEFGRCSDDASQQHRVTALCLMSEIAKDFE